MGHTHIQHKAVIDGKLILNPGSVGQPRDDDPRAGYAVVDTDAQTVDLHRVEYDVEAVQNEIEKRGLPSNTGKRLSSGK